MSDISKCDGEDGKCPIKSVCRRYKCKINPYRQAWMRGKYVREKGCDFFLTINTKEDD